MQNRCAIAEPSIIRYSILRAASVGLETDFAAVVLRLTFRIFLHSIAQYYFVFFQVLLIFMQRMDMLLSKTPPTDVKNDVLPMIYR